MNLSSAFLIACLMLVPRPQANNEVNWDSWKFLVGDWVGEGSGQPGQGSGSFSFHFELQGKILVRKNRSDYPATKDRPAVSHEDLMVIYPEAGETPNRAIYFDNEGHVIHYAATFADDGNSVTFLSDAAPSAPRFRLTYVKGKEGKVTIRFEIAPPGKPEAFSTYLEGAAHRAAAR